MSSLAHPPHSRAGVVDRNPHHLEHEATWTREIALRWLESPRRQRSGDADRLWAMVDLRPREVVADIGAGTGYFALPAAALVGPRGRVYAIDVSRELLKLIEDRVGRSKLAVQTVRSTPQRIPLRSRLADVVLLANVLHGLPITTVAESFRLLRPGGRLVVVEWVPHRGREGPPASRRLSPRRASDRLRAHGGTVLAQGRLSRSEYVLVATRARRPP